MENAVFLRGRKKRAHPTGLIAAINCATHMEFDRSHAGALIVTHIFSII